jgi:hypothetical protein
LSVVEGARRRMPDEAEMLESRLVRLRRKVKKRSTASLPFA